LADAAHKVGSAGGWSAGSGDAGGGDADDGVAL